MHAKNRFRLPDVWRHVTATVVGSMLALGLVAQVSLAQDSDAAHRILIELAGATWEKPLVASTGLETTLAQVAPRLLIEHTATAWLGASESSIPLEAVAAQVEPRIWLAGAATSSLGDLAASPDLALSASSVTPRLLIEHAATSSLLEPFSDGGVAEEAGVGDRILIEHAATSVVESPTPPPGWVAPSPPPASAEPVAVVAPAPTAPPSTPAPTAVKPTTTPAPPAASSTPTSPATTPTPAPAKPTTAPSVTKPAATTTQPSTTSPTVPPVRPSSPTKATPVHREPNLWWLWVLCGVAAMALVVVGARILGRRRAERPVAGGELEVQRPAEVTPAPIPTRAPAETPRRDRARPSASALSRRSPAAVFLLPFVTFGIYALYWLVRTKTELNATGAKIPTAILLIIPIANLYWLWKFGEGVDYVTDRRMSTGVAFLLVLFLDIIGSAIIQSQLNQVER